MLKVTDLSVSYNKINAVRNASFEVNSGEIVSLIGSNGAGKTTTLKTISGLLKAKSGSIQYNGEELLGRSPSRIVRDGIVHVPEGRQVFDKLTVRENLDMGGYTVRDRRQIEDAMEYVFTLFPRLKERQSQLAGSLSGGEQQMLAIGRALISGPQLLLLDEPSLGLAPLVVEKVFDVIRNLKKEGKTILLVEQNAADSLAISDRAYIMASGEIVLSGTGSEVASDNDVRNIYLGGEESWSSLLEN